MSRLRGSCFWCHRQKGRANDLCTNPDCPTNQKLIRRGLHPVPVRIDTTGGTNRERPHTAMALAFAKATLARGEPMTATEAKRGQAPEAGDEQARELLKEYGTWRDIPKDTTNYYVVAARARAITAEDALKDMANNPGYVEAVERQSLLDEIARLTSIAETAERTLDGRTGEYQRLLKDYEALRSRVADYQDMPDPQEVRRLRDTYAKELAEANNRTNTAQGMISDLQQEVRNANSRAIQAGRERDTAQANLRHVNDEMIGTYTAEQTLQLLMPLARRVHGLEAKLFEQAGVFP